MPMKKGHSPEVVRQNVREMISAGHAPKQAIAAALSNARKYKKMADGGMVDMDDDEGMGTDNSEGAERSLGELNEQGAYHPEQVASPEQEEFSSHLAKALYKKSEEEGMMKYADGGLVEGDTYDNMEVANKPSEDMMDSTEEPMSDEPMKPSDHRELSEAAKMALMMRKKSRRFS